MRTSSSTEAQFDLQAPASDAGEPSAMADSPPAPLPADERFHWSLLALATVVLSLSVILEVRDERHVLVPGTGVPLPGICTFQRLVGIDCPGCGLTRCFISAAHGDLASAWRYNSAGLLLFAMLLFQVPYRAIQIRRLRRGMPELHLHRLSVWMFLLASVALMAQWMAKILS